MTALVRLKGAGHARRTGKELYHQCRNIICSCTFITTETVESFIVSPGEVVPAPPHPTQSGQQQIHWM
ncbi:ogr/Delta-like zinc finger family protein [Enterobacter hormaechei]